MEIVSVCVCEGSVCEAIRTPACSSEQVYWPLKTNVSVENLKVADDPTPKLLGNNFSIHLHFLFQISFVLQVRQPQSWFPTCVVVLFLCPF